ncbi:MAG: site-specific DNA-methyltransferase, partial [Bacteroidetes bacterium]
IEGDLTTPAYTEPLSVDFLKANDKLVLDTAFFPIDFKYRLLAEMDGHEDIDTHTNGLLVHSENFQALRLLQERYKGQAKCIYIDPPYNAKSSEILYKNTYKHASWLSLMYDRLLMGALMMRADCVHVVAIDEVEQEVLGQILRMVFPAQIVACLPAVHNPRGQQGKNISYVHEFAYFIYPGDEKKYIADTPKDEVDARNLRDSGGESDREDAKTCFYPILVKDDKVIGFGEIPSDEYHPESANILREDGVIEVWPLDESGNEKKWRYSVNTINKIKDKLEPKNGRTCLQIIFNKDTGTVRSLWTGAKYDASEYGTKVLQDMLGTHAAEQFSYPKSIHTVTETLRVSIHDETRPLVIDYFAGSATTAHSLIQMQREGSVNPKYVLAEMGEYFELVTRPRTLKAIYSADWKNGKPTTRDTGISHCFKYLRLESYEDALNNLELEDRTPDVLGLPEKVAEDYLLRYALD